MIKFLLNDKPISTSLPPGTLVLDFVRYHQQLSGTKIGCREGDCGACTILVGEIKGEELIYQSATSCLMALGNVQGKHVVTIEGVNVEGLNFIQQAFVEEGASQCGFCTPGFIVSLAGFCLDKNTSCSGGIDAVNGNICRCTGYKSIERAVEKIAVKLHERKGADAIAFAIEQNILPAYFSTIKSRLAEYQAEQVFQATTTIDTTKIVGGGTDLYVQQHEAMVEASIHFINERKELKTITQQDNQCLIGATTTVSDLLESPIFKSYFPSLYEHIKLVSSTPIRNMATVAGNFVNASPIGDLTIFFLALGAQLILSDGKNKRTLALCNFYKGYKDLNKTSAEFIEYISIELPFKDNLFNFEKVSKRTHLDIASVNTAILLTIKEGIITKANLSAGGVGPIPLNLSKSGQLLQTKKISEELIEELIAIVQTEISPISDARGTETYKRLLLGQLIKAHFITLFPHLEVNKMMHA